MPKPIGQKLLFAVVVAGLGFAIYNAVAVGNRLQQELVEATMVVPDSDGLPSEVAPLRVRSELGGRVSLDFTAERTLLAVFNPRRRNFGAELRAWNEIARERSRDEVLRVVGIASLDEDLAEIRTHFEFPVFVAESPRELFDNDIVWMPTTAVVARGGKVEAVWSGGMEDPGELREYLDAVASRGGS